MSKLAIAIIAFTLVAHATTAEKRAIVCKAPANASACTTIHGRLRFGSGTPALRLWHIGTTHEFGIFSGPDAEMYDPGDNEHPQLPGRLGTILGARKSDEPTIYADFDVCPLEPFIPGHMQAACIASATHITLGK
jgi:hypothetical protein